MSTFFYKGGGNILPSGETPAIEFSDNSKPSKMIADVCFKGGLIDSWGRGTVRIIEVCKEAGLPEPELTERDGGFLVTLFKDNLTEEQLVKLGPNARQVKAVSYVKEKGRITNSDYQTLNEISDRTSSRDLEDLVAKGVLKRVGDKKSAHYEI